MLCIFEMLSMLACFVERIYSSRSSPFPFLVPLAFIFAFISSIMPSRSLKSLWYFGLLLHQEQNPDYSGFYRKFTLAFLTFSPTSFSSLFFFLPIIFEIFDDVVWICSQNHFFYFCVVYEP
jgi:hypothetical protein